MKAFFTAALIVLIASAASAQFKRGDFEMMLLGTVGSMTTTTTYKSALTGTESESDATSSYAYVSFIPAFYFTDGLAAELELGLRAMEGDPPAHTAILHLAYTHPLPRSSMALFARAGYGMANGFSVPVFGDHVRMSQDFDISIINLGAGAKFMLGRTALLRAEINYRIQNYSEDNTFGSYDRTANSIALLMGVGVVL